MRFEFTSMALFGLALILWPAASPAAAAPDFELENNWLQWVSYVTGQDEGIEQNLTDNFGWMRTQGYTHLRFFGIYPNGVHAFPSPTLDANGYPNSPLFESVLPILVAKANEAGIVVNFDGWEVIAEANRDPSVLGVDVVTEAELAEVVREVLAYGVTLITEEQFGQSYLQAIQTATQEFGAVHETTAGVWWPDPTIADAQLASVFTFYPYDQQEMDTVKATGSYSATLGVVHIFAEGCHYHGIPFSLAAGSFGLFEPENWKNAMLFSQIAHLPERFSVEESDTNFTISDPSFNFKQYVGNQIVAWEGEAMGERPVANLVVDTAVVPPGTTAPAAMTFVQNCPVVANTFTLLGYRVITTLNEVLPGAQAYFVSLAGGPGGTTVASLPDYVLPLLSGDAPVIITPGYGLPDENDAGNWQPLREFFGLPAGDTDTLVNVVPTTVNYDGATVRWSGNAVYVAPVLERILRHQVDPTDVSVELSAQVSGDDVALLLRRGNKILVNSNVLHLEASYPLSRLLGGPLHGPMCADVAVAADRTIIYAEYDGSIDLDIAWSSPTLVTRNDPAGNRVQDEVVQLPGRYTANLSRGEFVFLRRQDGAAIPATGTWAVVVMALMLLTAGTVILRGWEGSRA